MQKIVIAVIAEPLVYRTGICACVCLFLCVCVCVCVCECVGMRKGGGYMRVRVHAYKCLLVSHFTVFRCRHGNHNQRTASPLMDEAGVMSCLPHSLQHKLLSVQGVNAIRHISAFVFFFVGQPRTLESLSPIPFHLISKSNLTPISI